MEGKSQETQEEVKEENGNTNIVTKIKEIVFGKKEETKEETVEEADTTEDTSTAEEKKGDDTKEDTITDNSLEEAIKKAKDEAIAEYQQTEAENKRKASLSPEELKAEEDAAKDTKIQELEKTIMKQECESEAIAKLDSANLPVGLAGAIDFGKYDSKEEAATALDVVISVFGECLEDGIKNRLKGKSPEGLQANTAINAVQDKQTELRKYMGIKPKK